MDSYFIGLIGTAIVTFLVLSYLLQQRKWFFSIINTEEIDASDVMFVASVYLIGALVSITWFVFLPLLGGGGLLYLLSYVMIRFTGKIARNTKAEKKVSYERTEELPSKKKVFPWEGYGLNYRKNGYFERSGSGSEEG